MSYTLKTTVFSLLCSGLLSAASVEHYYDLACDPQGRLGSIQELAEAGDYEKLLDALNKGANANQSDELGRSPLHLAVMSDNVAIAKVLIDNHKADVLAKDSLGRIPAQLAKSAEMKAICDAGLVLRQIELDACKLIEQGKCSELAKSLNKGLSPNALSADHKMPLLGIAIKNKQLDCVKTLLNAGADPKARLSSNNAPLLSLAAVVGTTEIIRLLLANGADAMAFNNRHSYPIHEALWSMNEATVEALLPSYASVNFSPDGRGNGLAVGMAILRCSPRMLTLFIDAGMDVNHPMFKMPLLSFAVVANKPEQVKILLKAGAKKDAIGADGKKASHYAKGAIADLLKN